MLIFFLAVFAAVCVVIATPVCNQASMHITGLMLQGLQPDILPVAMMLCQDPTAAVRSAVAKQMGQVVCKLWLFTQHQQQADRAHGNSIDVSNGSDEMVHQMSSMSVTETPENPMQQEIVRSLHSLASSDAYQMRQQYVEVSYHIAAACESVEVQKTLFRQHFMQTMLELAHDRIANVRLAVARAVSNLTELAQLPEVLGVLDMLERDDDLDVASCCNRNATTS